jgi:ligand-binding sensor domain-containing protein
LKIITLPTTFNRLIRGINYFYINIIATTILLQFFIYILEDKMKTILRLFIVYGLISIFTFSFFFGFSKKGEKWTIYSNIGDVASIIFKQDQLLLGTTGGLVLWNIEDKTYKKFTTIDGLGDNRIGYFCFDSSEILWIGSYNSITKFDGNEFEAYQPENILADRWVDYKGKTNVREMHFWPTGQDDSGNLWFTALRGISKFTEQGWFHRDLSPLLPPEVRDAMSTRYVFDSKNRLWGGFWGFGVCMIDSLKTTVFTKEEGIGDNFPIAIFEDSKNNIWIGHRYNGVSKFDGMNWTVFDTSAGLSSNWVYEIYEDKQNNIWFGSSKGISCYDGKVWTKFQETARLWPWSFTEDIDGKLWAATSEGIYNYNGLSWEIYDYHPDDLLTNNWVITGAIDYEGNLWFGTGTGLCMFDGKDWQQHPLLNSRVNALLPLKTGEVWAGMYGGAARFSNGEWKIYTDKDGLANNHVLSIAQDLEGRIWFGTVDGLSCFDNDKWKTFTTTDGLLKNPVPSIAVDSSGTIWCASELGISTYDGSKWKNFTVKDGLPEEGVFYITFNNEGILWFSSHGGGIGNFDGNVWKRITMEDGLPDNFIYSITPDEKGRIWVATENAGACVFQNNSWRMIKTKDGLPSNYVRKVLIDNEESVWFATGAGVSKLQGFRFPEK